MLRQLPSDHIRAAGHSKRALKKHRVTDFEFVDEHWLTFGAALAKRVRVSAAVHRPSSGVCFSITDREHDDEPSGVGG